MAQIFLFGTRVLFVRDRAAPAAHARGSASRDRRGGGSGHTLVYRLVVGAAPACPGALFLPLIALQMAATTAFAYKAGTGKGCFADHIKQVTGSTEWFDKLKTLDDLPRWWRLVVPEIDVILSVSDTSIKALTTWHAAAPSTGYPLNAMEDMYLRKVVMIHCASVPELKAAFDEIGFLHRPDKDALSRDGTAAALLASIMKEVITASALTTSRAKATMSRTLQGPAPTTIDGVRRWCEKVHAALSELRGLLSTTDYVYECVTATHYCDLTFSAGIGAVQWTTASRTSSGTTAALHERLATTARAIAVMQAFGAVGNSVDVAQANLANAEAPARAAAKPPDKPRTITCFTCHQTGHHAGRCPTATTCIRCGKAHNYIACTLDSSTLKCTS